MNTTVEKAVISSLGSFGLEGSRARVPRLMMTLGQMMKLVVFAAVA
jgi:hypothetical protein